MTTFDVCAFGAAGDGVTDDAAAIQRAVDACAAAGGGRVLIPAGRTVRAGSFELRSRIEFHVAEGATLMSATAIEAFPRRVFDFGVESEKRLWIGCRHAEDVTLSGTGTIDGQCHAFAGALEGDIFVRTVPWRPALTCFEDVRRLTVRDLTFRNAANWTLHFCGCEDVEVADVRIANDIRFPNADGIDPDHCRRVRIHGCHIVAGDDCIVLKNTAPFARYGPCEDIEISDCRLRSASAAFKVGSESHNDFRRVRLRDCVIEHSNRGLAVQLRDGGDVEDLEFSNIEIGTRRYSPAWWGAGEPVYITSLPRAPGVRNGVVRGLRFRDLRCTGENGMVIFSTPPGHVRDILFERVSLAIERHTPWPSGLFDLRPCPQGFLPPDAAPAGSDTPWGRPAMRACAAVSIDGAAEVRFSQFSCRLPSRDTAPWSRLRGDAAFAD